MAAIDEPILVKHEPFLGRTRTSMRQYKSLYPYRLAKWDPAWIFVVSFSPAASRQLLWVIAGFSAVRVVIWCSFRFPLATSSQRDQKSDRRSRRRW
jgi:hypothetical protein